MALGGPPGGGVEVRRCAAADADADAPLVAALGARLFAEAYGPTHPEPELGRYLARAFAPAVWRAALADPEVAVLVARTPAGVPDAPAAGADVGRDVGYAVVAPTAGPPPPGVPGRRPFELRRFYVDARWHGRGVAGALLAGAEAAARGAGADALWLDVWQEAARPIAFYRRAGFAVVGTTTFAFGERLDADFVMARVLPPAPDDPA